MKTTNAKPAGLWLRVLVVFATVFAIVSAYEFISTSGHKVIPTISMTSSKSFTLRISGPSGLKFCGTISVKLADGKIATHDVDGVAPETFELLGKSVSVNLRKCQETGYLKVAIAANGRQATEGFTKVQYGAVEIGAN